MKTTNRRPWPSLPALKEHGLAHTGKKAELVQRLAETSKTISRAGGIILSDESLKAKKVSLEQYRLVVY